MSAHNSFSISVELVEIRLCRMLLNGRERLIIADKHEKENVFVYNANIYDEICEILSVGDYCILSER